MIPSLSSYLNCPSFSDLSKVGIIGVLKAGTALAALIAFAIFTDLATKADMPADCDCKLTPPMPPCDEFCTPGNPFLSAVTSYFAFIATPAAGFAIALVNSVRAYRNSQKIN